MKAVWVTSALAFLVAAFVGGALFVDHLRKVVDEDAVAYKRLKEDEAAFAVHHRRMMERLTARAQIIEQKRRGNLTLQEAAAKCRELDEAMGAELLADYEGAVLLWERN